MRRKKSRRGAAALIVALCLVVVVAAAAVLLLWDGGRLLGLNRPGGSGSMDSEQAASRSALEAERDALRQQLYEPVLQPDAVVSEAGLRNPGPVLYDGRFGSAAGHGRGTRVYEPARRRCERGNRRAHHPGLCAGTGRLCGRRPWRLFGGSGCPAQRRMRACRLSRRCAFCS